MARKESFPPTPTAESVGFFLGRYEDRQNTMRSGLKRPHLLVSLLVSMACLLCFAQPAFPQVQESGDSPKSLLLFPFSITSGEKTAELVSFIDHANRTLREAIETLGSDYKIRTDRDLDLGSGPDS